MLNRRVTINDENDQQMWTALAHYGERYDNTLFLQICDATGHSAMNANAALALNLQVLDAASDLSGDPYYQGSLLTLCAEMSDLPGFLFGLIDRFLTVFRN